MTEPRTVFVTKWATTEGILAMDVVRLGGRLVWVQNPWRKREVTEIAPRDWHLTREAAVSRATAMRDAKIASLEQQIARLRGIGFD